MEVILLGLYYQLTYRKAGWGRGNWQLNLESIL